MIICERSIDLGNGKSVYAYGGKYYVKSGDQKKEISANQYKTILNGKTADKGLEDLKKSVEYTNEIRNKIKKYGKEYSRHAPDKYYKELDKQGQLAKDIDDDQIYGPGVLSHLKGGK
jgi:uncharacterized protein (DUF1330 family)